MKSEGLTVVPETFDLSFSEPIFHWDEAIPLGSGLTGCLMYGGGAPLRLGLDRGDLWDCRPAPEVLAEDYTYEELIRLVREENGEAIEKRFDSFYNTRPTPTKVPTGGLELYFNHPERMRSRLHLQEAEGTAELEADGIPTTVSVFVSAATHFGHLRIVGAVPRIEAVMHDFTSPDPNTPYTGRNLTGNSTKLLDYPAPEEVTGEIKGYRQKIHGGEFALLYGLKPTPDGAEAVWMIGSSNDGDRWMETTVAALKAALDAGYEAAKRAHTAYWNAFWEKSAVSLPDEVLTRFWYLNNYYFGSCSRKGCPPTPLQGVWTADDGTLPPWKGDYHGDLNVQFTYYPFLKSDHLPEFEAFPDFYAALAPVGRKFSRKFFGCEGLCIPPVFAFDGTSLGGWPMYATNLVNHLWELHLFEQYYRYTEDEAFLNTFWGLMEESEKTIRHWLRPDEAGVLRLPLSSSPEINDNRITAWLESTSTNDAALLRWFYGALTEFAPKLGKDAAPYAEILAHLPEYPTDEHGYRISRELGVETSHRHLSHLMQVYPLRIAPADETLKKSVERLRELGPDFWVGFSFCWSAVFEAKIGCPENAVKLLRAMADALCSPNGFHLNGDYRKTGLTKLHYRPFTLESNFMINDTLQEMLLDCDGASLRIFPHLPEDWKRACSFDGFRAYGGVKVSAKTDENGACAILRSPTDRTVSVAFFDAPARELFLPANTPVTLLANS